MGYFDKDFIPPSPAAMMRREVMCLKDSIESREREIAGLNNEKISLDEKIERKRAQQAAAREMIAKYEHAIEVMARKAID